ncbi:DNA-binding transcriptional regulator of sugar metabolism, DeoR/GlpR family [Catalinimonas alkaloidigena]|uniref:DNA-binding transcriptional regulator of sugar metabolism, DeoR/GlpR family n=1 Tax=Catalinimonas alkaloidigena TaxID=1075417 RepID=A0A1G9DDU9_9BACT|nr:DeoR/GlpR family DNA-binding transcription regulator [Catalinimonas alkaloidigena]SDK61994.1 DNA-binding transcriptional regulator of sugar metabolism, DeoR/GlpR family [Catalinimonas alkaloidigena]
MCFGIKTHKNALLREERLQYILLQLRATKRVTSTALSEALQVSDDTIRRDLHELAEQGLLRKVHGGAIPLPTSPLLYAERLQFAQPEKSRLAQKALPFLESDTLILLDGGTTNLAVAKALPADFQATIFTNSVPIAQELMTRPRIELVILGGRVFKQAQVMVGSEAIRMLDDVRATICLLGACSVHPDVGVSVPDREEAQLKRKMVACSARTLLLATHEKLDTASHYIVCPYDSLDTLIAEPALSAAQQKAYAAGNVTLL